MNCGMPGFPVLHYGPESGGCSVVSDSLWLYSPWNSPGQNTRVGSLSLLQGIFPTQGLSPGLPHCRRILYQLSSQGSPLCPRVCSNSCPLSERCHPSHPPPPSSFAFSLSQHQGLFFFFFFLMIQLFTSGSQGIGASALASVLPMST